MQEKHVKEKQCEHQRNIIELQEKLKKNQTTVSKRFSLSLFLSLSLCWTISPCLEFHCISLVVLVAAQSVFDLIMYIACVLFTFLP